MSAIRTYSEAKRSCSPPYTIKVAFYLFDGWPMFLWLLIGLIIFLFRGRICWLLRSFWPLWFLMLSLTSNGEFKSISALPLLSMVTLEAILAWFTFSEATELKGSIDFLFLWFSEFPLKERFRLFELLLLRLCKTLTELICTELETAWGMDWRFDDYRLDSICLEFDRPLALLERPDLFFMLKFPLFI